VKVHGLRDPVDPHHEVEAAERGYPTLDVMVAAERAVVSGSRWRVALGTRRNGTARE
jgi:hypothetical protein